MPASEFYPVVSVTIPVLNGERFLAEAIESVLDQSYPHWELLVVDDGSSDRTPQIIEYYAESDPSRIRALRHPGGVNKGMIASRNLGLRHSRGTYIARLDADDTLRTNAFSEQVSILEANARAAMVYGPVEIWRSWSGSGRDVFQRFSIPMDVVLEPPTVLCALLASGGDEPVGMFVRRSVLNEIKGYSGLSLKGDLYEDIALNVKLCLRYPVIASSQSWYRYRDHEDSYCSRIREQGEYEIGSRRFVEWCRDYFVRNKISDKFIWDSLDKALVRLTD